MSTRERYPCERVGLDFFATAPIARSTAVEVAATPERVFALFLDADAWVRWAPPITAVHWTSGLPLEVGSTRDVHMWGGLVGHEEFLTYDHGRRMAFRFNEASRDDVRAFAEDYLVTSLGGGRCRVEWTMALDTGRSSRPRPAHRRRSRGRGVLHAQALRPPRGVRLHARLRRRRP